MIFFSYGRKEKHFLASITDDYVFVFFLQGFFVLWVGREVAVHKFNEFSLLVVLYPEIFSENNLFQGGTTFPERCLIGTLLDKFTGYPKGASKFPAQTFLYFLFS